MKKQTKLNFCIINKGNESLPIRSLKTELIRKIYPVVVSASYGGNYLVNLATRRESFKSDKQL